MFSSNFKFRYFPGWLGWVESRIRLISAETEAEALLGLTELGKSLRKRWCSAPPHRADRVKEKQNKNLGHPTVGTLLWTVWPKSKA